MFVNITVDIAPYLTGANKFSSVYKHLSRDKSPKRRLHELRCIQRWFILKEYMSSRNIPVAFFSDGDSAVFGNITDAYHYSSLRNCSTVLNIEPQPHRFHWVAAGEASLWTMDSISDFCGFTFDAYSNLKTFQSLKMKFDRTMSSVVDMSLLWLWWVAHTPVQDFVTNSTSRDYYYFDAYLPGGRKRNDVRLLEALTFSKSLNLPAVQANLTLCNGMRVRNDSVFDHMHAWQHGYMFSLNIDAFVTGQGLPYARLKAGDKMLMFLSIHYQGDSKKVLLFDFCRIVAAKAKALALAKRKEKEKEKASSELGSSGIQEPRQSLVPMSVCEGVLAGHRKKAAVSCGEHGKAGSSICF
eukprot:gene26175-34793_t